MRNLACALITAGLVAGTAPAALAQHDHGHDHGGWHGDIHHFHDHDFGVWRGGRWFHGDHGGRPGWWWVVGPTWYYYPAPVYPYPDPYVPPVVTAPPPAPATWYYCDNPPGYYPYVPQCTVPWRPVPVPPAQ
jgi:hypothetical protein